MDGQNSLADLFRFMQIKPTRPTSDIEPLPLDDTELTKALNHSDTASTRIALADRFLADPRLPVREVDGLALGTRILDALSKTRKDLSATVATLIAELADVDNLTGRSEFTDDRTRLSDTLLAATTGTVSTVPALSTRPTEDHDTERGGNGP